MKTNVCAKISIEIVYSNMFLGAAKFYMRFNENISFSMPYIGILYFDVCLATNAKTSDNFAFVVVGGGVYSSFNIITKIPCASYHSNKSPENFRRSFV